MNEWFFVIGQIGLGLVLLVAGGEFLVRGAVALASALHISPLVIGLTVVAFGTSAPELGVSLQAAFAGSADVAIGNVVGSNIINTLFVLGAAALVTPLIVSSQLIRLDVPIMIAASGLLWWMSSDGSISQIEGITLFTILIVYIVYCIRKSRSESKQVQEEYIRQYGEPEVAAESPARLSTFLKNFGYLLAGLLLLGLGSNWLVDGATKIATSLGISQLVIGLTVVAIGTSLPEVVTSIVASYRGERDIAVGNVVGSNLFNILCVLGLTATVSPAGISIAATAIHFDIPVMFAVSVICMPIFMSGHLIDRMEGALFLMYYAAYNTFIVMTAKSPFAANQYTRILFWVVLPLTILPIVVSIVTVRIQKSRT
ncbi:Inner membrane protein YrbG [Novipirellula aureliae]|uniref:Inner membrane protein YrbG n=1 Tax=Novipirellula aureliae TaxID=2527966 RepID=A0A5C6ED65_9BACT|nr:calcium/sodium antiporter [Novipirellula aureliae]TWU45159.1 Inner membrane protein YrbG [Novipirellula aureliae]